MRTGTNWTTLVKLPEEVFVGKSEKLDAVAGVMASTRPGTSTFKASTWTWAVWPTWTRPMLVSSRLAFTHSRLGSTIDTIGWPGASVAPTAAGTAITTPSNGAT